MRSLLLPGILACALTAGAVAQSTDRLPAKLTGHWTVVSPNQTFINPITLAFDGDGQPGPIRGRASFRGVGCGSENEPITGTWDGVELRIDTLHRPNVNTVRMGGQCGDGKVTYVLRRKPGTTTFEGEGRSSFSPAVAAISVAP